MDILIFLLTFAVLCALAVIGYIFFYVGFGLLIGLGLIIVIGFIIYVTHLWVLILVVLIVSFIIKELKKGS